jgi:hypothetical protein
MLIPLGILASSGAGVPTGDYELISSTILTGNQASVTFSNLGDYTSTYKHLQIRWVARSSVGSFDDYILINFNGDTSARWFHVLGGSGSSVSSGGQSLSGGNYAGGIMGSHSGGDNIFGAAVVDILDWTATKNRTTRSLVGAMRPSFNNVSLASSLFDSTAAITSIALRTPASVFVAGSRFSLYGIKG